MKKSIMILSAVVGLAGAAHSAEVVQDWFIGGGNGTASGNTWLDTTNAGRGIDFIAAGAAQNNKGEAVVVLTNQQGSGASSALEILAADDGQNLGKVPLVTTGDGTIQYYRVATSDDGYIFVNGYQGTIQRYNVAGGAPVEVIADDFYSTLSPAVTANARALEVTGSVADGTAKIFVAKGNAVVVFANSSAAPEAFNYVGHFAVSAYTTDIANIASHDGTTVYVGTGSSAPPNDVVKKLTFTYSPSFSVTVDGDVSGFAAFVKQGLAVNEDNTLMAIAEAGGNEDGFAIAQINGNGLVFDNIAPDPALSVDADAVYDAGPNVLNAPNAVVDVAMDPVTGDVYAYSNGSGTDGGVAKIRVEIPANVSDWAIY